MMISKESERINLYADGFDDPSSIVELKNKTYYPKNNEELLGVAEVLYKNISHGCNLGQIDLSKYEDVSLSLGELDSVLEEAPSSFAHGVCNWKTSKIQRFDHCWCGYVNFNEDISCWDFSSATSIAHMLSGCKLWNHSFKHVKFLPNINVDGTFADTAISGRIEDYIVVDNPLLSFSRSTFRGTGMQIKVIRTVV